MLQNPTYAPEILFPTRTSRIPAESCCWILLIRSLHVFARTSHDLKRATRARRANFCQELTCTWIFFWRGQNGQRSASLLTKIITGKAEHRTSKASEPYAEGVRRCPRSDLRPTAHPSRKRAFFVVAIIFVILLLLQLYVYELFLSQLYAIITNFIARDFSRMNSDVVFETLALWKRFGVVETPPSLDAPDTAI